jgi:hypothetical protein
MLEVETPGQCFRFPMRSHASLLLSKFKQYLSGEAWEDDAERPEYFIPETEAGKRDRVPWFAGQTNGLNLVSTLKNTRQ